MTDIIAEVVHGRKIGRALGFPTANMSLEGYTEIERGVYRSSVEIDGTRYRAMSNVGIRPSVGGKELLLELCVTLEEKLRDEKRFSSISDLKEQLQRDYAICAGK